MLYLYNIHDKLGFNQNLIIRFFMFSLKMIIKIVVSTVHKCVFTILCPLKGLGLRKFKLVRYLLSKFVPTKVEMCKWGGCSIWIEQTL